MMISTLTLRVSGATRSGSPPRPRSTRRSSAAAGGTRSRGLRIPGRRHLLKMRRTSGGGPNRGLVFLSSPRGRSPRLRRRDGVRAAHTPSTVTRLTRSYTKDILITKHDRKKHNSTDSPRSAAPSAARSCRRSCAPPPRATPAYNFPSETWAPRSRRRESPVANPPRGLPRL